MTVSLCRKGSACCTVGRWSELAAGVRAAGVPVLWGNSSFMAGGLVNDSQRAVPWTVGGHKKKGLGLLAVGPSGPLPLLLFS